MVITIRIDLTNRTIEWLVSDEIIAERKEGFVEPEPKVKKGYLARYAKLVTSANTGAVMKI